MRIISVLLILTLVSSCTMFKTEGEVTKEVGETLDEKGDKKESEETFIGKSLNFVGGLFSKIGGAAEDKADDSEGSDKSKDQVLTEANDKVTEAAVTETKAFSEKNQIYDVQERLTNFGYSPGPIDGIWGKKSEKALMEFQTDQGLSVTGEIDDNTLEALGL